MLCIDGSLFHFFMGINVNLNYSLMDVINTVIAAGGFSFAIYQFVHQNRKNRVLIMEQNEKNWYLSVLVIPQMERINVFFENCVEKTKALNIDGDDDMLHRSKELTTIKESVEAFFSPLEAAMKSFDHNLSSNISDIEQCLEDTITKIIDAKSYNSVDIERKIMEYKGKLISALYKPIKGR